MEVNRQFHAPAALPVAECDRKQNLVGLFGDERDILPVPKIEPCFRRQDHFPMSAELWEIKRNSVGNWQRFSIQYLLGVKKSTF
jgi:hypothetical protein